MDKNLFFQKKSKSQSIAKVQNKIPMRKMKSQLNDLIEVNEDETPEEEDIQNLSFSLSNCEDMNDLLEHFSNKSNKSEDKIELEYESTTNEEGLELIEDYLRESTKQILNSKKGFDDEIKKMSSDFYTDLIQNINIPKDIKKKIYLDKTKNTNYMTKSESITSDDQTKFKNDLLAKENKENDFHYGFGKVSTLKSKTSMSNERNSSQYMGEEDEEDKIIEVRKKKVVK